MNAALNPTVDPPPTNGVVLLAAVTASKSNASQTVRVSAYRYREGLLHNADDLWSGPMIGQHLKPGRYYFNLPEETEVAP
jgi:hypothetical protein